MVSDVLIIIGLCLLGIAAIIMIPRWQIKRALPRVIKAFRYNNALDPTTARSIEELGLKPRGMFSGSFRGRDYRPQAMSLLMNADIIQATEDGRFFLAESRLIESGLENQARFGSGRR